MLIYDALEEYFYAICEISEEGQYNRRRRLERFVKWLKEHGITELDKITNSTMKAYSDWIKEQPNQHTGGEVAVATVHLQLQFISIWFKWCVEEKFMERSPRIVLPKLEDKIIDVLTPEQINELLRETDKNHTIALRVRDKAIMYMLLDTGIRVSELVGLTLDRTHFEPNNSYIRVFGKGKKWREVAMGNECVRMLRRYLREHRHPKDQGETRVFLSYDGHPLRRNGVNQMLYRLKERTGIDVRVSAHTWRHTYATMTLENGGEIYRLSRSMGHSKVAVTEGYVKAVNQRNLMNDSVLDRMKGSKRV